MCLAASKRKDFDENITKYVASVPYLMIYPSKGEIMIESTERVTVGNKPSTESYKNEKTVYIGDKNPI